ncbi:hypothetical protein HK104_010470 [Borealophlyctis nickersoniae]|nr:hypothetical protein HK104_010470 [Borealophlyctis nickersoniae]
MCGHQRLCVSPKYGSIRNRKDIDELVASLVGERSFSSAPSAAVGESPRTSSHAAVTPAPAPEPQTAPEQPTVAVEDMKKEEERERPVLSLVTSDFVIIDVAPKEKVMYNKEAQTMATMTDAPEPTEPASDDRGVDGLETPKVDEPEDEEDAEDNKPPELTEPERKMILSSERFMDFFDHSTKLIQRALNEPYDFMRDYTISDAPVRDSDGTGTNVKHVCTFFDDRLARNRCVTALDWSPKFDELLLASYNKNPMAVNDPDGLVLVWNVHLKDRPEFVFHSQSDVMTASFSEFHPNFIIGGTYSGQVVLWDTRAKSLPVLKTPLSAAGHTHPIQAMTLVGTQNAHGLMTASSDGLICTWQLDMLAQPQETLDLVHPSHPKTDEIAITSLGFPDNETTTFWVGTEEGNVYQANRYERAGSKAGINAMDTYKGHSAMITGLHFHPQNGSVDFSDLFLTSSVDWTVKLWRVKSFTKPSSGPQTIVPLYSFEEADDYVYDAQWSPTHPALFGMVDGSGNLDFYHLNQDLEVPIVSIPVTGGKALNKMKWDQEGQQTAVGSSDGHVYIHDLGEIAQAHSDEWSGLKRTIGELELAQQNSGVQ